MGKEKTEHHRPTWDEYFMDLANTAAKRATCDRGRSGCIIVRDKQVLVTGYVGSPKGMPHCDEVGHLFKKVYHEDNSITQHCVRTVHAEQNAICQAARRGIALNKGTLYCKMTPCRTCAANLNAVSSLCLAHHLADGAPSTNDPFTSAFNAASVGNPASRPIAIKD